MSFEGKPRPVTSGNGLFAGKLLTHVLKSSPSDNTFLSPFSISCALAMAMAGSRGRTQTQMLESLGFKGLPSDLVHSALKDLMVEVKGDETETKIANRIFVKECLLVLPDYSQLLMESYGAEMTPVDFGQAEKTAKFINNWVSACTNGKIPSLVGASDLTPSLAMIITNAVHFKSSWLNPFMQWNTHSASFYVSGGQEKTVDMMYAKKHFLIAHHDETNCDVLELPYKGGLNRMWIFLPKDATNGIQKVVERFNQNLIEEVGDSMRSHKTEVWLPKFRLEHSYAMAKILKELGMEEAFSVNDADFSAITGSRDVFISEVIHKTFVEVNEEGTEAAAVTAAMMCGCAMPLPEEVWPFRADHPFVFTILNSKAKHVLFLGCFQDPK